MAIFQQHKFKREEHVYVNNEFSELLKDAVRFFHGTPVLSIPLEESFKGAGVYAIYCISKKGLYKTYGEKINRLSYDVPIYVVSAHKSLDPAAGAGFLAARRPRVACGCL